jgi:hypothetical protein
LFTHVVGAVLEPTPFGSKLDGSSSFAGIYEAVFLKRLLQPPDA